MPCLIERWRKVDRFVEGRGAGKQIVGCHTIEAFCAQLERPRKVMILVKAGPAVDALIEQLLPYLEREILLLMVEIAIIPIRFVERNMWKVRGCSI